MSLTYRTLVSYASFGVKLKYFQFTLKIKELVLLVLDWRGLYVECNANYFVA